MNLFFGCLAVSTYCYVHGFMNMAYIWLVFAGANIVCEILSSYQQIKTLREILKD